MGGSGRQSLTRIATFMAEYSLFTIEISRSYTSVEWREDLRSVLKRAGAQVETAADGMCLLTWTQWELTKRDCNHLSRCPAPSAGPCSCTGSPACNHTTS